MRTWIQMSLNSEFLNKKDDLVGAESVVKWRTSFSWLTKKRRGADGAFSTDGDAEEGQLMLLCQWIYHNDNLRARQNKWGSTFYASKTFA